MECEICKGTNKNFIFETKYWRITLADNQSYLGRCFIDLKRHAGALSDLTKKEILDFLEVAKKLEKSLKKSFGAEMFNWSCLMNNAYKETSPNPHVHWHFRPRYRNKVEFDDIEFNDFEFGHHYDSKRRFELTKDELRLIINKIKENL